MNKKALHTKTIWKSNLLSDIRTFDCSKIFHIHFCDGSRNAHNTICDETLLSGVYAGEGNIPVRDWVNAVKATGYNSWWSYELVSSRHWQLDVKEVAEQTSKLLDQYVFEDERNLRCRPFRM